MFGVKMGEKKRKIISNTNKMLKLRRLLLYDDISVDCVLVGVSCLGMYERDEVCKSNTSRANRPHDKESDSIIKTCLDETSCIIIKNQDRTDVRAFVFIVITKPPLRLFVLAMGDDAKRQFRIDSMFQRQIIVDMIRCARAAVRLVPCRSLVRQNFRNSTFSPVSDTECDSEPE